jgi:hypothetical protein
LAGRRYIGEKEEVEKPRAARGKGVIGSILNQIDHEKPTINTEAGESSSNKRRSAIVSYKPKTSNELDKSNEDDMPKHQDPQAQQPPIDTRT